MSFGSSSGFQFRRRKPNFEQKLRCGTEEKERSKGFSFEKDRGKRLRNKFLAYLNIGQSADIRIGQSNFGTDLSSKSPDRLVWNFKNKLKHKMEMVKLKSIAFDWIIEGQF